MSQSFRSKHLLAIQIDNGVTQIAELHVHAKSISVIQSFSLLTPSGMVESDGTLLATESFASLLREQISAHGIKTDRGVFCVNSDRIISREILLPNIKRAQILTMINTNAQDYFPVDVSDYKLDYSVQEQVVENGVKMLRVLARAVPKALISSYYALAKMMEIGIAAIDISGNSVLQAVGVNPMMISEQFDPEGSTYMVANLYSNGTQLTFIKDGTVRLQRTVSLGFGEDFDQLLSLNSQQVGEICGYEPVLQDPVVKQEIIASAHQRASELAMAINRIIEYYYSTEGYGNGRIYGTVVGAGILLPTFTDKLFDDLDMQHRIPRGNVTESEDEMSVEYGLYLPCLGACLSPLNLIDKAQDMTLENICAKRRWLERVSFVKRNVILLAGASIFAICLLVSALMAGSVLIENTSIKQRIEDYQQKIEVFAEVAEVKHAKGDAESIRDLLIAYKEKLNQLEQDRAVYEELLAENKELAEIYEVLQQECIQLENDFNSAQADYTYMYAIYDDFSKSIWTWYEEIMYTLDEEYMNTNNDNLVAFIEELEKKMPTTFTVTAIAVTDQGINMGIEVTSKQQVVYVLQTLREFETVEIQAISGLTIVNGGPSDLFEEEIEGDPNPTQRVRFTVALKYTEAFREQRNQ